MVVGDNKTSYKQILCFIYDPLATNAGKKQRAVDVVEYDVARNKIVFQYRGGTDGGMVQPSPKIAAYLQGRGSVPMASDANITILGPTPLK